MELETMSFLFILEFLFSEEYALRRCGNCGTECQTKYASTEPGSIYNMTSRRQEKGVSHNMLLGKGTPLQYKTIEDLRTVHCTFPFASHSGSGFEGHLEWDLHSAKRKKSINGSAGIFETTATEFNLRTILF